VKCLEDIGDRALIETCTGGYILAHDNGYFTVGEPREDGKCVCFLLGGNHCTCFI